METRQLLLLFVTPFLISIATGTTTTHHDDDHNFVSSSIEQYDYVNGNNNGNGNNGVGGMLSPLDTMIQQSSSGERRLRPKLTCHVCHSEKEADCIDVGKNHSDAQYPTTCAQHEHVCMVRRFSFTVSNGSMVTSPQKTFAVKRNCSAKCEPGCVVMGERTRIYVCSTCCDKPLCNVGASASSVFQRQRQQWQRPYYYLITFVLAATTALTTTQQ